MKKLSSIKGGEKVTMASIEGGCCAHMNLADMGFLPGVEIQVVTNYGLGSITILIKGTRLALGKDLAEKILVR